MASVGLTETGRRSAYSHAIEGSRSSMLVVVVPSVGMTGTRASLRRGRAIPRGRRAPGACRDSAKCLLERYRAPSGGWFPRLPGGRRCIRQRACLPGEAARQVTSRKEPSSSHP